MTVFLPAWRLLTGLVLASLISSQAIATVSVESNLDALLADARTQQLATDAQWLALLHVNRGGTTRDRGRSYVDDPRFFLAADGADNPAAELEASIRALFAADAPAGDSSARCRFVARHQWLALRLAQPAFNAREACPAYRDWIKPIRAGRVTLVFPGSYLNSPSSMFGHTLLRIDPPAGEEETVWLARAVSFGADTGSSGTSLSYMWKGIAGGYPGRFQVEPYFGKIQHYGRMENRDLWEYPLDLDATETAFLVDHLWEVHDISFDYYFFDENCSYRLLELIEVARPSLALTNAWRFSEAPVNTVRVLRNAGVARDALLRPSAERELRARIAALNEDEENLVLALQQDAAVLQSEVFRKLTPERQGVVVATAYANFVYRSRKKKGRDSGLAAHGLQLLRAINTHPKAEPVNAGVTPAPETGHPTHRISLGGGALANEGLGDGAGTEFVQLGARITYHDMLDPLHGYMPGAELEMGDFALRSNPNGDLKLEYFDLISVFSLGARDRFFRGWSWRVHAGIERQPMADMRLHSSRLFEGGGGLAWRLGDVYVRAYGEARLEHSGSHDHLLDFAAGPSLGLVGQHRRVHWSLDARPLYFSGGMQRSEARAALQWQLEKSWGLRFETRWRGVDGGGQDAEFTDAQIILHHYY
jgi:hypothetical protein